MKLVVIGFGQCGGNIADEFFAVNEHAKSIFNRHVEILTEAFAINTDETDLGGFKHIPKDKGHRILIGNMNTFGHGVGKINTEAASIIKSSSSLVIDSILRSDKFHECDAVMAIASGGGGTGSGTIGWVIKTLKERVNKPVYGIVVMPFAFEERGTGSLALTNTATCVNTVNRYADATFLVDNERYRKAGSNLTQNFTLINQEIASCFYDLCCAGEERRQKYVGGKVLDAGDIKQSLTGLSVLGRGEVDLSTFIVKKKHFREGAKEQNAVFGALQMAEGNPGLSVDYKDARKMLVLVCAQKNAVEVTTLEEITAFLQEKSPDAIIRIGDYPRRGKEISVTLIASQLTTVPRLERLFVQAELIFKRRLEIDEESVAKMQRMQVFSKNIPTLD